MFTEQNPRRELSAAAGLAASARALRGYDDALAAECLRHREGDLGRHRRGARCRQPPWAKGRPSARIGLAVELLLTTGDRRYADYLVGQRDAIVKSIKSTGWVVGRALPLVGDAAFTSAVTEAVKAYRAEVLALEKKTPYGVPYEPDIWGAGWGIQGFGMEQYFLHTSFPEIFPKDAMLHALDFVLGVHPGPEQRVVRLGRRLALGHVGLRPQPRRLGLHPGRQRLGHGAHPAGLPGAARVAVPLAADGVRARRRHDRLPVPGARRRPPAEPGLTPDHTALRHDPP